MTLNLIAITKKKYENVEKTMFEAIDLVKAIKQGNCLQIPSCLFKNLFKLIIIPF